MPELPEVETVARDLRGLVVGAEITAVRRAPSLATSVEAAVKRRNALLCVL